MAKEQKTNKSKIIISDIPEEDILGTKSRTYYSGRKGVQVSENISDKGFDKVSKRKKSLSTRQHFFLLILALLAITAVGLAVAIFAQGEQGGGNTGGAGALSFKEFLGSVEENALGNAGTGDMVQVSPYALDAYDSADTAVLTGRNDKDGTMSFLNLDSGRSYTLSVDGAAKFYDKYGTILAASQVSVGDVVDITFLKEEKRMVSLQLSAAAWKYEAVAEYEILPEKNKISIGADEYRLTADTQFFAENNSIELMDLNPVDVLSFQGIGKQVLSITVDKGHGYLRLKNDENFVGGWIEVGKTMICKITEDMLLAVPEGQFEITVSYRGGGGKKTATIYRDEETTLDIGDLEVPAPKSGQVLFSVSPADAEVYIDGTLIDTSAPVNLLYGLHQLIARADGYQSITQYIRVAQPTAGINVTLDLVGSGDSGSSTTEDAETTTDYYKVYVDAPVDAEVYLDGNYIGIAPCSFKKEEGTYVIILRKSGYETRSYTINIDDSEKDLSYSFADLVENP